jgi:hypothetical protein
LADDVGAAGSQFGLKILEYEEFLGIEAARAIGARRDQRVSEHGGCGRGDRVAARALDRARARAGPLAADGDRLRQRLDSGFARGLAGGTNAPRGRVDIGRSLVMAGYVGPDGFQEQRGHPTLVGRSAAASDPEGAKRLWERPEELTA